MRSKYAWLLLPPVLALIVFFGPMQSLNNTDTTAPKPAAAAGTAGAAAGGAANTTASDFRAQIGSQLPEIPNLWQIGSSLLGVILLGIVFLMVAKRFRGASPRVPVNVLSIRQSLRLSPKHHVHVVQFEERVLLLGAAENSLTVLLDSEDNGPAADEREIARRAMAAGIDPEEDGAVPRDMILPRPEGGPRRRKLPRQPRNPRPAPTAAGSTPQTSAQRAAPRPGRATSDVAEGLSAEKLATFRALLKKARQGATT